MTDVLKPFAYYSIRHALACYALDENPQHLWTVWRVCRKNGIDVPPVVLKYLDGVADKLDPQSEKHNHKGRIENRIRDAIMGDSKAPADTSEHIRIAKRAFELSPNLKLNEDQRLELAELADVDERTIRRWLKKAVEINNE